MKAKNLIFILASLLVFVFTCTLPGGVSGKTEEGATTTTVAKKYGSASINLSGLEKVISVTESKNINNDPLLTRSLVVGSIGSIEITIDCYNADVDGGGNPIKVTQTINTVTNGIASGTITNIPVGLNRVVVVKAKDASDAYISGAEMKAVVDIYEGTNTITVNWDSTAAGDIYEKLLTYDRANGTEYTKNVNSSDVLTFLATLGGVHSSLIDTAGVANYITSNAGTIPTATTYVNASTNFTFTFTGAEAGHTYSAFLTDPASSEVIDLTNDSYSIAGVLPGTTWKLVVKTDGVISNVIAVSDLSATPTVDAGIPVDLTAITPDTGKLNNDFITNQDITGISGTVVNTAGVSVKFTIDADLTEYNATVASGIWNYSGTLPTLSEGQHTITYWAVYDAANYNAQTVIKKIKTITIDKTSPNFILTSPANGDTVAPAFTMSGTAEDTGSGIDGIFFDLENTTASTTSTSIPVTSLPIPPAINWSFNTWGTSLIVLNSYNMTLKCVDIAGNEFVLSTVSFTVGNSSTMTIYVKPDGDDSKSGKTIADAVKSVSLGVEKAIAEGYGLVKVASGVYDKTGGTNGLIGTTDGLYGLHIKDRVGDPVNILNISGGWDAATFASLSGTTTLDGTGGNFQSIVRIENSTYVNINNLTITKGGTATTDGGGICITASSNITLDALIIDGNTALNGGGIYISGGADNMINNSIEIKNNTAETNGGGIFVTGSSKIQIEASKIGNNTAKSNGGGVYIASCTGYRIFNGVIQYNKANAHGGGIYVTASSTISGFNVIDNETIEENTADFDTNDFGDGGGIYLNAPSGNYTIGAGVIVRKNQGVNGGGIFIISSMSSGASFGGILDSNRAIQKGGAAYLKNSNFFCFSNATNIADNIINNSAQGEVGGIYLEYSASIKIEKNQFKNNRREGVTGINTAIYIDANSKANIIDNTIIGVTDGWKAENDYFGIYSVNTSPFTTGNPPSGNKFDTDTMLNFLYYNGQIYNDIDFMNGTTFYPTTENSISGQLIDKYDVAPFTNLAALFNFDNNHNDQRGAADGTSSGTLDYTDTDSKRGYSVYLDGNYYISIPDAEATAIDFAHDKDFTISVWVKVASDLANNGFIVGNGLDSYLLYYDNSLGKIVFVTNYQMTCTSNVAISKNQWYHIVAIRDATNNKISISADGGDTFFVTTASYTLSNPNANPFTIGAKTTDGIAFTDRFRGYLDDLRIYNKALDAAELTKLRSLYGASAPVSPFGGGDGTSGNPYQVSNATQLNEVRNYLDKYFIQTGDIDLSSYADWTPIGDLTTKFTGNYNGNGKMINNLKHTTSADYVGLFGCIDGATIKNTHLSAVNIMGNNYVGSLVASSFNASIIENCSTVGSLKSNQTGGGLIGQQDSTNGLQIIKCWTNIALESTVYGTMGGIIGRTYNSNITISQSYAIGSINAVSGTTSDKDHVGGLVGFTKGGTVTINNCYATGNVWGKNNVGGLIGYMDGASVTNCYATGSVNGTGTGIGGLIGKKDSGTVTNSFYDSTTSLRNDDDGRGAPRNSVEMINQATFTGWAFDSSNWKITDGVTYPYLSWQINVNIPKPVMHMVTFNANGGTLTSPSSVNVPHNNIITPPITPPTFGGSTFEGWRIGSDTGAPFDPNTTPVMGPMTLYAKWNP